MKVSKILSSIALTGAMLLGASTVRAEEPIITFHTNVYDNAGGANAFHFYLGAKEPTYYDIDCGFGSIETEVGVAQFDSEAGGIAGTVITCSVSSEGMVRIYGDASKIDYIDMEGCYISDISFPQLTEVEILNLSYNELNSLDLSHMTKIQALYLSNNPFSKSPLVIGANKPDLAILSMSIIDNLDKSFNLSDYPAMRSFEAWHVPSLEAVDPTGCPNLLQLSIDLTNVSSIDVSKNPNLLILNVADTRITELDITNNRYLTELYCGHSASGYSQYKLKELTLGSMPYLKRLFCQANDLTTLDISGCPKLTDLSASHNLLTSISIDNCPDLINLNISMNLFTFASLPEPRDSFNEYYYYQRPIAVDRSYAVGTTIDLSDKVLREGTTTQGFLFTVSEDAPDSPVMLDEEYYTYADGKITLNKVCEDSVQVTFINDMFQDYPLSTSKFMVKSAEQFGKPTAIASLAFFPTVKQIALSVGMQGATAENPLKFYVDFGNGTQEEFTATTSGLPETPNVTGTRTGRVTIYMPEGYDISAFGMEEQRLMNVDFKNAVTLAYLSIVNCQLPAIDLTWNRCLQTLNLSGNNLSVLNLEEPNGSYGKNVLTYINASNNRISEISLSTRTCIHSLNLSNNQLNAFDLLKLSELVDLNMSGNLLTDVDLRDLEAVENMNLANNSLTEITLLDYLPLKSLDLSGNNFMLDALPLPGVVDQYEYAPQKPIALPAKAPSINLSANYFEADDAVTQYRWVMDATGAEVPEGKITVNGDGLFKFDDPDLGVVRCEMTHTAFPDFTGENVYTTTPVQTAPTPTHVFATLTTLQEANTQIILAGTAPETTVYIDWEDNGYMEQYILGTTYKVFPVKTKANTNVKCYSYDENDNVTVFSTGGVAMADVDVSGMKDLITFTCAGASLPADKIKLPTNTDKLQELGLYGNAIESIDLSAYTALKMINLSYNKLASYDASPFKKLQALYLTNNGMSEITLDNPVMWELALNDNKFEQIDLSKVPAMFQLYLSRNLLSEIDITGMPRLNTLNIDENYFTFATLPLGENILHYVYDNQTPLTVEPADGYIVDLASQVSCHGVDTKYTWYIDSPYYDENYELTGESLLEGTEYTLENGVTTFLKPFTHIMCLMTNSALPNLVLYTNFIDVTPPVDSIEEIAAACDLDARWYNLNGVEVARTVAGEIPSLATGIYIRVTVRGADKVLVK